MLGVWQYLQGELAGLDGFEEVSLLQKARRQVAVQFAKTLSHPRLHLLLDGLQTQGHSVTMQACNKYLLASFAVLAPFHDLTQSQREILFMSGDAICPHACLSAGQAQICAYNSS